MAKYLGPHPFCEPPIEVTAQWYERMLGAEVIRTMHGRASRASTSSSGGANIFIAPVAPGDGVNPPPATPYQGLDHFGLTVSGIDAVVRRPQGARASKFTKEPDHGAAPGVRVAFLRTGGACRSSSLSAKPS
jgi:hypothetical protein